MTVWDPAIYNRYKAYRDRPALDLMLRLPQDLEPREVWDLGCGAGEQAAGLKRSARAWKMPRRSRLSPLARWNLRHSAARSLVPGAR